MIDTAPLVIAATAGGITAVPDMMAERPDRRLWASYSQLTTHRSCPQRWFYGSMLKLRRLDDPDDPKVELNFGLWWHALMAADSMRRGREHDSLRHTPDEITAGNDVMLMAKGLHTEWVIESSEKAWADLPAEAKEIWLSKLGEPLPDRLRQVYRTWTDRWAVEREYELPLAVELGWGREITDTARLVGYVDEVYFDTRRNIVVVRDHKTGKQLPSQSALDDMMDSQLQLYAWGAAPVIGEWGMGPISATAYDRVKSVKPTTPRLNKSGTLSKTVTQFDIHAYLDWVAEGQHYEGLAKDGSGAGTYQADPSLIDHLESPAWRSIWHQRTLIPLNANMIRAHLRSAVDTISDIHLTRRRAEQEGAAARNLTGGCKWCDFAALCRAQIVGGPDGEYPLDQYKLAHATWNVLTGERARGALDKEN